jgi:hypothetical protein
MDAQQTQAVAPIATQQHWVQCENPNCNKWRLLPAGTEVNENEAWYCYMNPDPDKNTCSASEAVSRFHPSSHRRRVQSVFDMLNRIILLSSNLDCAGIRRE